MNKIGLRKILIFAIVFLMLTSASPVLGNWGDSFADTTKVEWTKNTIIDKGNVTVDNRLFHDEFPGDDASTLDANNWTWNEPGSSNCNELNGNATNRRLMIYNPASNVGTCYARTINSFSNNIAVVNFTLNITSSSYVGVDLDIVHGGTVYARLDYTTWGTYFRYELRTMQSGSLLEIDHSATTYPPPAGNPASTGLYVTLTVKLSSIKFEIRKVSDNSAVWVTGNWYDFDAVADWQLQFAAYKNGGPGDTVYEVDNVSITSAYGRAFVRSGPITLPSNRVWDMVYFNSTTPANTYVNVSVLDKDNKTIAGFNNVTSSPIDISTVPHTTDKIKLLAMLDGNKTLTTPMLKDWNVTWKPDVPVQKSVIADIHILEDSMNNTFDLTQHFTDNYTTSNNLIYTIVHNTLSNNVSLSLNNSVIDVSTSVKDWNGDAGSFGVSVSDGEFVVQTHAIKVIVDPVNDVPVFTSIWPSGNATVGKTYYYNATATDVDKDHLTFALNQAPTGLSISSDGKLVYNPAVKDNGTYVNVYISVTDGHVFVWQNYSLWVEQIIVKPPPHGNDRPPEITSKTPTLVLLVGDKYSYQVVATDPDNDTLYYGLDKAPLGMTIGGAAGLISWTATVAGVYTVTINVTDGNLSDTQTFVLHVLLSPTGNNPPVITSTPSQLGKVNETYSYTVAAYDPENDDLTFVLQGPVGMNLTNDKVSWTPKVAGVYTVTISVADYQYIIYQYWNITVQKNVTNVTPPPPKNRAPVISNTGTKFVTNETSWSLAINATDQDNNTLFYTVEGPANISIDTTGMLTWANTVVGNYTVTVTVGDGKLSANYVFQLEVDKKMVVVPPKPHHGHGTTLLDNSFPIIAVVAVGAGMGGVGAYAYSRRKKDEKHAETVSGLHKEYEHGIPAGPVIGITEPEEITAIDDIFLVYRDGRLISHRTRQLKPDMDDEVLGGMFTAVQEFVKTSFGGDEGSSVDEISYGGKKILIEHGKYAFLAVVIIGDSTSVLRGNIKNALYNIEFDFEAVLAGWNGQTKELSGAKEYLNMLIAGLRIDRVSAPVVLEEQKTATISGKVWTEGELLSKLSSMPRGMPMVFIGKDPSDLAAELVTAKYVDNDDGDAVFLYENKWHYGNPGNLDTWLQKAHGPSEKRLKAPSIDGELDELGRK